MTLATVITSLSQILAVTALVGRMPISHYFFGVIIQFVMTLGIRFAYRFVPPAGRKSQGTRSTVKACPPCRSWGWSDDPAGLSSMRKQ